ncbi:MAG: hypothetical protein HYY16_15775 [Planctomycetes bacterium]|nr:hypothetical protein [Planctomycetota bacterium]
MVIYFALAGPLTIAPLLVLELRLALTAVIALQAACVVGVYLALRHVSVSSLAARSLCYMAAHGAAIGLVYCAAGVNSWSHWAEYCLLSVGWTIAVHAGFNLGALASNRLLAVMIATLALGDLLLFIPRIAVVGLDYRSPWGGSLWVGSLLVWYLCYSRQILGVVMALVLSLLLIGGGAASGMRFSVLNTGFAVVAALVYVVLHRLALPQAIPRATAMLGVVAVILVFMPISVTDVLSGMMDVATNRLGATLLNPEGPSFDEDGRGRELEAELAIQEFVDRGSNVSYFTGFGHGFVFDNARLERKAHIHITPVAFYVRYGILGVLILAIVWLLTMVNFVRSALRTSTDENVMDFCLQLTAAQIITGSLVAGSFVFPLAWFIVGVGLGSAHRSRRASTGVAC